MEMKLSSNVEKLNIKITIKRTLVFCFNNSKNSKMNCYKKYGKFVLIKCRKLKHRKKPLMN